MADRSSRATARTGAGATTAANAAVSVASVAASTVGTALLARLGYRKSAIAAGSATASIALSNIAPVFGKAKADDGKAASAPLNTSSGVPGIRGAEFMTHTPKAQAYSDRMGDPLYRYAIAKSAAQGDAAARAIQAGQPQRPMINGAKASAPSDGAFIDRAAQIAAQNAVAQKGPSAPIGATAPSGPAQRSSYTTVDGRTVEATEAQARAWGARRN